MSAAVRLHPPPVHGIRTRVLKAVTTWPCRTTTYYLPAEQPTTVAAIDVVYGLLQMRICNVRYSRDTAYVINHKLPVMCWQAPVCPEEGCVVQQQWFQSGPHQHAPPTRSGRQ